MGDLGMFVEVYVEVFAGGRLELFLDNLRAWVEEDP